jgi:hypothetical protein
VPDLFRASEEFFKILHVPDCGPDFAKSLLLQAPIIHGNVTAADPAPAGYKPGVGLARQFIRFVTVQICLIYCYYHAHWTSHCN